MNKQVFLSIANRLESKVPTLDWIDWDSGQLDLANNERPSVAFPCCLIDLEYPTCEEIGGGMQLVTCNIVLRVAFAPWGETSHVSPVRENTMAILDTIEDIHDALQNWSDSILSILSRQNAKAEKRKDGLKVYRITYQTTFTETISEEEEPES